MSERTIWYSRCPDPTALGIAAKLGWLDDAFLPEGIVFRSLASARGRDVRGAHFDVARDDFIRIGGNVPALVAHSRGSDARIISLASTGSRKQIFVLPDSGVRSLADLRGRRVSLPRQNRNSVDFWQATVLQGVESLLASAGLGLDAVEWVDVPVERTSIEEAHQSDGRHASLWHAAYMIGHQREEALALATGRVDAVFSHGAIATYLAAFIGAVPIADFRTIDDPAQRFLNDEPIVLTASRHLAEQEPDILARLLDLLERASDWARANPEPAKRIIAAEVGLPEELVDITFEPDIHTRLDTTLAPVHLARLDRQIEFLARHGLIASPVIRDELINSNPLERQGALKRGRA